jgi:hypothetical protein
VVDIYLYPEASFRFDIILSRGLRSTRNWGWPLPPEEEKPVVAGSLYLSLVERYGRTMGLHVFEQMYAERKGPFGEDAKYDPDKPKVARKIAKAGGIMPDPQVKLQTLLTKKLRGR